MKNLIKIQNNPYNKSMGYRLGIITKVIKPVSELLNLVRVKFEDNTTGISLILK